MDRNALAEQIAILERLVDTQVELTEKLFDRVAYLEESVLQLERTKATARSRNKKTGELVLIPSEPEARTCE